MSQTPKYQNRREHLEFLLETAMGAALGPAVMLLGTQASAFTPGQRYLVGGFHRRPIDYKTTSALDESKFSNKRVFKIDLSKKKMVEIESKVAVHVVEAHPLDRNLGLAISRRSNTISMIDWQKGKETLVLKLPTDHYFYGHAAFSVDGKHLVATGLQFSAATYAETYKIFVINAEKMTLVESIPFPAGRCHDVHQIGQDHFVVGTSSDPKFRTRVLEFDLKSQKFTTVFGPTMPPSVAGEPYVGHLISTSDDQRNSRFVALMNNFSNGETVESAIAEFSLSPGKPEGAGRVICPYGAPGFETELLSFAETKNPSRLWMTAPTKKRVYVWDLMRNRLEGSLELGAPPRSLSIVEGVGAVVGTNAGLHVFDTKTLKSVAAMERTWPQASPTSEISSHTRLVIG